MLELVVNTCAIGQYGPLFCVKRKERFMENQRPVPGDILRKDTETPFQIIAVAKHEETGETMVVYQNLYGDFDIYIRTLAEHYKKEGNQEKESKRDKTQEPIDQVNEVLMKFLDSNTYEEKLSILTQHKKKLDDTVINNMAVSIDVTVEDGPIEDRIQGLMNCIKARARFEKNRLR